MRLFGRAAIVTGGSRGIGEGITRVFHREGANVLICGLPKHRESGIRLLQELNSLTKAAPRVAYVDADLRNEHAATALVEAALENFGR
jgi:NAD(P)-dependent dehydrogenase (short-subunit alcohol dehydrogenase family)